MGGAGSTSPQASAIPASMTTAVRRNNNRRSPPADEHDSGTVLPLHGNNMGNNISGTRNNATRRKRTRRSRKNRIDCCGLKLDIPVVGVAVLLLMGVVFLVFEVPSFLHASGGGAVADLEAAHHKHFQNRHLEGNHQRQQAQSRRTQHEGFPEDPNGGARNYPSSKRDSREVPATEEEGAAEVLLPEEEEDSEALILEGEGADVLLSEEEEESSEDLPALPIRAVEPNENIPHYDVVVAGAGPAGLTAALFASRAGLSVYVLGSPSTGLLSQTKRLDNFPSFVGQQTGSSPSGPDWVEVTLAQAKSWGANFSPPGLVAHSIERQRTKDAHPQKTDAEKDVFFSLATGEDIEPEIRAWSVVVASGAIPRKLGLSGEDKLWGVSLHTCAICDGHLYQGTETKPSTVLVVGGGDAALDAALMLARYATKVILVHRRDEFSKAHNLASLHEVRSAQNIEVLKPYVVKEWITKDDDPSQLVGARLTSPKGTSSGEASDEKRVDIDGAFVTIGAVPNTKWTEKLGVALDDEGLIRTTANLQSSMKTMSSNSMITASSVPGLFAAGEVTDNVYKQAITAAAAGAQAAIDAERWLREQRGVVGTTKSMTVVKNQDSATHTDQDKKNESRNGPVSCDLVSEDCIQSIVGAYPVVVFSKKFCPYCRKALEALSLAGITKYSEKMLVIELTNYPNTQDIQTTLQKMTGRRTVPNVFIGGKSIGGGDETTASQKSGKLVPLLVEAGAIGIHNDKSGTSSKAEKADEWRKIQQDKPQISGTRKAKDISPEKKQALEEERRKAAERKANASGSGSDDSSETESCDLSTEECIEEIIQKYPILLFSLSWCPECKRSLELLERIGISEDQIHIIDLDDHKPFEKDIRAHMKTLTGRMSVPNLFVGGDFVGGFAQTAKLHKTGELVEKFQRIGALTESSDTESCDLSSLECMQELIQKYPILLFSLDYCPWCKKILELLSRIGITEDKIHIIDLGDHRPIEQEIRGNMKTLSGQRGVPNLFVGGKHIGGFNEAKNMHKTGDLIPEFQNIGALAQS